MYLSVYLTGVLCRSKGYFTVTTAAGIVFGEHRVLAHGQTHDQT